MMPGKMRTGLAPAVKESFVGAAPQMTLPRDVWQSDGEEWESACASGREIAANTGKASAIRGESHSGERQ
ncbi:MAG: hypothetical protein FJ280_28810 [Planctomycetes bacterium]|nr:hypothetical protein [Planctomycetota bacterium]